MQEAAVGKVMEYVEEGLLSPCKQCKIQIRECCPVSSSNYRQRYTDEAHLPDTYCRCVLTV